MFDVAILKLQMTQIYVIYLSGENRIPVLDLEFEFMTEAFFLNYFQHSKPLRL